MPDAAHDPPAALRGLQFQFTAHIRDPKRNPAPVDIEQRRMTMYRELCFNNVESFLGNNFPVLRQLHDNSSWQALVQDFFSRHKSKTPYFSEIAEEFLEFLENERAADAGDPPFMLELAHYEWVEMALAIAEGQAPSKDTSLLEDPLSKVVTLSDVAWSLAYSFPVHIIAPEFRPKETPAEPTYLVVYRNSEDQVQFLVINAVTFRLLELLQENETETAREILVRIAGEMQHANPEVVLEGGVESLIGLADRGVIKRI